MKARKSLRRPVLVAAIITAVIWVLSLALPMAGSSGVAFTFVVVLLAVIAFSRLRDRSRSSQKV
jgi:Flp pilus assembly protein TadB